MNAWLVAAVLLSGPPNSSASANAERLLGQVQAVYRSGGDLTATFTQRYIDRLRPTPRIESGHLWAKKDGRVRWRYEQPDIKEFVFDGKRAYFYEPDNAQVTVFDNFVDSPVWDMLRFVWGQGELGHAFRAEDCAGCQIGKRKDVVVALWPVHPLANIDHLWLAIEPATMRARAAELFDPLGNKTEYGFDDIKFGANIPDAKFAFTIPQGVSVLRPTAQGTENPAATGKAGEMPDQP